MLSRFKDKVKKLAEDKHLLFVKDKGTVFLEQQLPKITTLLAERVGPGFKDAVQNDEIMTKVLGSVYEVLVIGRPEIGLIVKEKHFVNFCLKRRDRLIEHYDSQKLLEAPAQIRNEKFLLEAPSDDEVDGNAATESAPPRPDEDSAAIKDGGEMWNWLKDKAKQALSLGAAHLETRAFIEGLLTKSEDQALQELRVKVQGMDDHAYFGFTLVLTQLINTEEQNISQLKSSPGSNDSWGTSFEDKYAQFMAGASSGPSPQQSHALQQASRRLGALGTLAVWSDQLRKQMPPLQIGPATATTPTLPVHVQEQSALTSVTSNADSKIGELRKERQRGDAALYKVFISHSWMDKQFADRLARDLEEFADMSWIDYRNLRPGDPIQETIDNALREMDLVLVIWSDDAQRSNSVSAEIRTCLDLGLRVIPCINLYTDQGKSCPPLSGPLSKFLGIDFHHYGTGLAKLAQFIHEETVNRLPGDAATDMQPGMKMLRYLSGYLEYLANYRKTHDVQDQRAYWIDKIIDEMERYLAGGGDRKYFHMLLDAARRNEANDPEGLSPLIARLEGLLK
ncbi:MAG TPA: toll/interleukin-1 receptor domain-containing protein [Pyrinomonadaceae bacterium]|nr:toll/interleukin-1 receptor domain-containing protein [Pyrinomonadaceae bacterium]